jgi:lauroyl/myristoyl acyltransferase
MQLAPRLGRGLSRLVIVPLVGLAVGWRMRAFRARTLAVIGNTLSAGPLRAFSIYVRSLLAFAEFSVEHSITCSRGSAEICRRSTDVVLQGQEHLEQAKAAGRPILVTTMHMGHFQLGFLKMVEILRPSRQLSVFKFSQNDRNEDALFEAFTKLGCTPNALRAGDGGGREAFLALRRGDIVALTIDLELQVKSRSIVTFFGRPCNMQDGPATIAALTRAIIVPVVNYVDRNGRRIVRAERPIDAGARDSDEPMPVFIQRTTQQLARTLESWISMAPHQVHAWSAIADTVVHPVQAER